METADYSEQKLREVYDTLRAVFENEREVAPESAIAYLPALPPLDPQSRLSATDLLSSWFRPPTGHADPWRQFFQKYESQTQTPPVQRASPLQLSKGSSKQDPPPKAVMRALFPEPDDELSAEEADSAIEVLYDFLHAVGRHDVEAAMQFVADDYHTFNDDIETDKRDLRNQLEAMLDSLHGWKFEVSLSMAPEPIKHPYGVICYVEIQLDAVHPESQEKRNFVLHRLTLLQVQPELQWRIAAMSHAALL